MERYDDFLNFDLPEGFDIVRKIDDEGETSFNIGSGQETNDEGQTIYAIFFQ